MGLLNSIREMLFHREPEPEATAARQLAQRISEHSDAIQNGAEKYIRAKDPFAALMADLYNRDQLSRAWLGNGDGPPTG